MELMRNCFTFSTYFSLVLSVNSILFHPVSGDEQVEEEPGEEGPAAGVLLGSLVVVVVLVLVLALLVRCLWARRGQEGHRGRGKSRGYAPPEKPGGGLSGECYAGLGEAGPQGLEEEWASSLCALQGRWPSHSRVDFVSQ